MSKNFAKTLVWKHVNDVKLWRHKQRTPNTNGHHVTLNQPPPWKFSAYDTVLGHSGLLIAAIIGRGTKTVENHCPTWTIVPDICCHWNAMVRFWIWSRVWWHGVFKSFKNDSPTCTQQELRDKSCADILKDKKQNWF